MSLLPSAIWANNLSNHYWQQLIETEEYVKLYYLRQVVHEILDACLQGDFAAVVNFENNRSATSDAERKMVEEFLIDKLSSLNYKVVLTETKSELNISW